MHRVSLTVNGKPTTAELAPRTQLADFLREHCLLTGTHIGCEHGVCGACTILLDGAPARSCIAYAAACEGSDVRTIEGLEDDPVMQRLRAAFTAEHALQCGYCTPGMLVTARDIVLRLPDADEARIRLELAGNLCRCTGYAGIVRAIRRVLAEPRPHPAALAAVPPALAPPNLVPPALAPSPLAPPTTVPPNLAAPTLAPLPLAPLPPAPPNLAPSPLASRTTAPSNLATPILAPLPAATQPNGAAHGRAASVAPAATPSGPSLTLAISIGRERAEIWSALHDPALLAACVPGARLVSVSDGQIEGEIQVALGPITSVFAGSGRLLLEEAAHRATLSGDGRDARSGTRLSGTASIVLEEAGAAATTATLSVRYALRGPLAQLARGPVVQTLAAGMAEAVARNLERRLAGETPVAAPARLSAAGLLARVIWQRLRAWLRLP